MAALYANSDSVKPILRKVGVETQNLAAEVKIRAERGGGCLLINDPDFGRGKKKRTLRDLDLEDTQSSRWQAIARIPEDDFERHIAEKTGQRLAGGYGRGSRGVIR